MAYALVGSLGAVTTGTTSFGVTPAFGQATTPGNLLVAWVVVISSNTVTVSGATGWVRATPQGGSPSGAALVSVWYKPNCGASETAPTFSGSNVSTSAMLGEFSGGAVTSPVDQTACDTNGVTNPEAVTCGGVDVDLGELVVSVGGWNLSKAGTCTTADTYVNGATPTGNANNDATSVAAHYRFAYGITTGKSVADSISETNSSMNLAVAQGTQGVAITSFLLASPSTPRDVQRVTQAMNRAASF